MKPDSYHHSPALLDDLIFSSEDKTGSQIQPGMWESSNELLPCEGAMHCAESELLHFFKKRQVCSWRNRLWQNCSGQTKSSEHSFGIILNLVNYL